jgi:peptidoglycan/xylan/chitin deacetylase (PgdA/CDA1 family)
MAAEPFPIFLYHGITSGSDPSGQRFDVCLDAFRAEMNLLGASARGPRKISELAPSHARQAEPIAAVTFDDGTADFHRNAWPVLRELGIAVTLYVTAGLVGKRFQGREMLSWRQLEELRDGGVEIGAHGYWHNALDVLSLDRAVVEIVNSKLVLEQRLGISVNSFAYPFGYHTERLKRLLQEVGYTSACAVKNSLSYGRDDPYALARVTVTAETTGRRFEQLLNGRGAPTAWHGERLRTRAWRAYRLARAAA